MPVAPALMKRVARRLFPARKPHAGHAATVAEDRLVTMIEEIQRSPLDPNLCFELGVELFRKGIEDDGLRYLDRSFRLDPMNVVRFVTAPEFKTIRLRENVVALLTRLHREEQERSYGAYA